MICYAWSTLAAVSLHFVPAACEASLMVYFVGRALDRRGYLCALLLLNHVFFDFLLCVSRTDAGEGDGYGDG